LGKSFWKSPWCHGQKFQNPGELCKVQQALGEAADVGWSTSCSLPIGPEDTPDTPWVFRSKMAKKLAMNQWVFSKVGLL